MAEEPPNHFKDSELMHPLIDATIGGVYPGWLCLLCRGLTKSHNGMLAHLEQKHKLKRQGEFWSEPT